MTYKTFDGSVIGEKVDGAKIEDVAHCVGREWLREELEKWEQMVIDLWNVKSVLLIYLTEQTLDRDQSLAGHRK